MNIKNEDKETHIDGKFSSPSVGTSHDKGSSSSHLLLFRFSMHIPVCLTNQMKQKLC